jgi:predicted dehydrogenase
MKLRIGLVGTGWVAQHAHLHVLLLRNDVTVVALCDVDLMKAKQVADQFGISIVSDNIQELLKQKLDLVIITTPTNMHIPLIAECLNNNVHVLCEKPLGMTSKEIERLLQFENVWTHLHVGYVNRYRKDVQELLEQVNNIHSCTVIWRRHKGIPRPGSWITNKELSGGGVLMDLGSHMLDLALECCDIQSYTSSGKLSLENTYQDQGANWFQPNETKGEIDTEDTAIAQLKDLDGRTIQVHVSWNDSPYSSDYTQIICQSDNATYDLRTLFGFSQQRYWSFPELRISYKDCQSRTEMPYGESWPSPLEPFMLMYTDLIERINKNESPACSLESGLRVARAIESVYALGGNDGA